MSMLSAQVDELRAMAVSVGLAVPKAATLMMGAADTINELRELLGIMAYCNQFRRDCDGCSMNGAAGIITGRAGCDTLLERLRDLGVKEDE